MKKSSIIILVLFSASLVAAQPIQLANTNSTDLDLEMAGGETETFSVDVETTDDFSDDFAVETRLKVSNYDLNVSENQDRVSGEEFSLASSLNGADYNECRTFSGNKNYSKYICSFDSSDFGDENTIDYRLDSVTNLMSGDYQFELRLLSSPSIAPPIDNNTRNITRGKTEEVTLDSSWGDIELELNSAVNGTAEFASHESVVIGTPNGEDEFISAVTVNINSTAEGTSDGTVRFEHSEDLTDVDVYLLDEGEWTSEGIEVVESGDNFVMVDVPHFSTYAAYGEETEDDTGGSNTVTLPDEASETAENQTEDVETGPPEETPSNESERGPPEDIPGNESEGGEETSPGQEDNEQPPGPTGLFAGSTSSIGELFSSFVEFIFEIFSF